MLKFIIVAGALTIGLAASIMNFNEDKVEAQPKDHKIESQIKVKAKEEEKKVYPKAWKDVC
ncbi:hypothetical protein GJU40_14995 [Bacillus lacus]|uniref:Uncharacterized protein n=1 Tax=Metabacillus lacus TaxID=1983721 RepID=A0A7X2J198_9BACI|nr:hypothetical protein [Metabacillus lacus]MRX73449.1 hypothetical protein [Metabacillus lacus]